MASPPRNEPGPDRLDRRLRLTDAVVVGLGAMLGAGVFAAVGPAAGAAGSWLLVGLVLAGMVAYANATSSAALAAVHPESVGLTPTGGAGWGRSGGSWPGGRSWPGSWRAARPWP